MYDLLKPNVTRECLINLYETTSKNTIIYQTK